MQYHELYNLVADQLKKDLPNLEEAIQDHLVKDLYIKISSELVGVQDVINHVCKQRGISPQSIAGKSSKREHAEPRMVIWWILNKKVIKNDLSLASLGSLFGRDHATALHGIRKMDDRVQNEASLRDEIIAACRHFGTLAAWDYENKKIVIDV